MSKKNLDYSAEVSALSEADNDLEAVANGLPPIGCELFLMS